MMKVIIEGEPKEIADLVLEMQRRRGAMQNWGIDLSDGNPHTIAFNYSTGELKYT